MDPKPRNFEEELKKWNVKWEVTSAKELLDRSGALFQEIRILVDQARLPPFMLVGILETAAAEIANTATTQQLISLLAEYKLYLDKNFMRKEIIEGPPK